MPQSAGLRLPVRTQAGGLCYIAAMMTRLWPHGEPVQMRLDPAGVPQVFLWDGAWHVVTRVTNRWRVRTSWWTPDAEAWQEYVKLTTADGLLCVLAHDLSRDEWRLVRLFD
jgi:hypothetical protein